MSKQKMISNYILDKIKNNELKPGDQIMTEAQLCEYFHVSRMTVNKAIQTLVDNQYIYRISGRGSFVNGHRVLKNIDTSAVFSFSDDIRKIGMVPGSHLISYQVIQAKDNPEIMKKLNMKENEYLHFFVRLRTADNQKFALAYTYLNGTMIPALDINVLNLSLYEYLKELNICPSSTDMFISAHMPSSYEEELLEVSNEAILKVAHTTYNQDHIAFEYTETNYIGKLYTYHLIQNIT